MADEELDDLRALVRASSAGSDESADALERFVEALSQKSRADEAFETAARSGAGVADAELATLRLLAPSLFSPEATSSLRPLRVRPADLPLTVRVEKAARWAEFIRDAELERVRKREQVIRRVGDMLR
jgi:hypothetical protein